MRLVHDILQLFADRNLAMYGNLIVGHRRKSADLLIYKSCNAVQRRVRPEASAAFSNAA